MSFVGRNKRPQQWRSAGLGVLVVLLVGGCTSSADTSATADSTVPTSAESTAGVTEPVTEPQSSITLSSAPLITVAGAGSAVIGCLTNGSLSGAFEEKAVDVLTEVNTRNEGENAPDAYYATKVGKNSIGYFVFGKKATVVVNGDGSWSGESGTDAGTIDIAADGTRATVKATFEGSDAKGQRAKPLTVDLVTTCGVPLPTTIAPTPVNTKQNVSEIIVEQTEAATTPS